MSRLAITFLCFCRNEIVAELKWNYNEITTLLQP